MARHAQRRYPNKMVSPETKEADAEIIEEKEVPEKEDAIIITDNEVRNYRRYRSQFTDDEIRAILKRQKQDFYRKTRQ